MTREDAKAALMEREKLTAEEAEARISAFEMKKRGGAPAPAAKPAPAPAAKPAARPTPAPAPAVARPMAPTPAMTDKAPAGGYTESAGGYTEGTPAPAAKYYMDDPAPVTTREGRVARLWLDHGGQASIDAAKAVGRGAQSAARGFHRAEMDAGKAALVAGKEILKAPLTVLRAGAGMGHQMREQRDQAQQNRGPVFDPKGVAEAKGLLRSALGVAPAADLRGSQGSQGPDYYDESIVVAAPERPAPAAPGPRHGPERPAPAAPAAGLSAEAFDTLTEADAYLKQKAPQRDINEWGTPEERVTVYEYLQARDAERKR